ncbi:rod shape-determining protein MreD [Sphingomonas sp. Leaf231]|uniref:rod shape-determining protein MreD n=1 Tax=Sphingomonas sp. Leaf231 TaxID=1736301 RepID=UPI0006FA9F60|nr:rod shape-determining protein MreD [Sphingomonas sp. Leaf231]KQN93091.1 rod shape-determining protein MreD [Sphingomonas sp. Leaf231]
MTLPARSPFDEPLTPGRARLLPWVTVMAGSLVTILPWGATLPLLPPVGLLILLSWRSLAPLSLRVWAPALLGLFDDLLSGQPIGSAMLLWTLAYFLIDAIDARSGVRDFLQSWATAALAISLALVGGRLVATPLGAHVDTVLAIQIVISILVFPATARLVAWIDLRRAL